MLKLTRIEAETDDGFISHSILYMDIDCVFPQA